MNEGLYNSKVPNRPLRQAGNLSYLDFIRVVERIWNEAHPEIPFVAAGLPVDSKYPCVVYSLANRVSFKNEVKPRLRERIVDEENPGETLLVYGQKFVNYVKFTVYDKIEPNGALVAEELIEEFEDFMIRYTPIFSQLGLNDFVYERRLADDEEAREGEGIVKRSVVYRVTTEKLSQAKVGNLEAVWLNITIGTVAQIPTEQAQGQFSFELLNTGP